MDPRNSIADIAGPAAMAKPKAPQKSYASALGDEASSTRDGTANSTAGGSKKKRHRAGKKRRNRRQSFAAPSESTVAERDDDQNQRPTLTSNRPSATQTSFYRLKSAARSNTSLESDALLDHRDHQPIRPRRGSIQQPPRNAAGLYPRNHRNSQHGISQSSPVKPRHIHYSDDEDEEAVTDRTPLISQSYYDRPPIERNRSGHRAYGGTRRRQSATSHTSSKRARYPSGSDDDYDVNNPPSMPGSPKLGTLNDVMIAQEFSGSPSSENHDAIINIDRDNNSDRHPSSSPPTPSAEARRRTLANLAENDVCYPGHIAESEIGEDDMTPTDQGHRRTSRRRRHRQWPDLDVLDEWSRIEKEERDHTEQIRSKKISEPVMVGGRLRPAKTQWHREEDDAPYRYTYFNETFDGTIHSRTISELCQFGATFRELFNPEPPELSDDSSSDEEDNPAPEAPSGRESRLSSIAGDGKAPDRSASATPAQSRPRMPKEKRYGPRPTFWLDVLSPTETEMKILAKSFGIHQLTVEDIMMQEPREKVELFQSYYFVNYRSFEQDKDNEEYMEPVNMYVVVFKDGVISFHFSMTPHPANVRRRIRQLNDYMSPTADWISYAIIDDITDVYAPLVQVIEDEVDEIDYEILALHSSDENLDDKAKNSAKAKELEYEKMSKVAGSDTQSEKGERTAGDSGGDMLRRVGNCRKKVMSLYRLLGNKADVIKGFAKRCNEHWEVAPRSEIGLYLGDIQDHVATMTGNLSHYENLLSRAHGNYLAQINIRMNERAEQTNDVLGKLTVLGTIVLPMNIVTGMWGMNTKVPGQDGEDLTWFWGLTAGLFAFGLISYFIAKRVYGIV
ncbi:cora-domain-containing protein, partial [Aureobasidium melanogenum]